MIRACPLYWITFFNPHLSMVHNELLPAAHPFEENRGSGKGYRRENFYKRLFTDWKSLLDLAFPSQIVLVLFQLVFEQLESLSSRPRIFLLTFTLEVAASSSSSSKRQETRAKNELQRRWTSIERTHASDVRSVQLLAVLDSVKENFRS